MLNDYMAEFRSLHAELQRLLDSAEQGADTQAATESKMREMKGKKLYFLPYIFEPENFWEEGFHLSGTGFSLATCSV